MKQTPINSRGPVVTPATFALTRAHVLSQILLWQRRKEIAFVQSRTETEVPAEGMAPISVTFPVEMGADDLMDLATQITETLVSVDVLKKRMR